MRNYISVHIFQEMRSLTKGKNINLIYINYDILMFILGNISEKIWEAIYTRQWSKLLFPDQKYQSQIIGNKNGF